MTRFRKKETLIIGVGEFGSLAVILEKGGKERKWKERAREVTETLDLVWWDIFMKPHKNYVKFNKCVHD